MTEKRKPLILISNDDGYTSDGIQALIRVARTMGDVVVAAPMQQQSGKSSSITCFSPLRAVLVEKKIGYKAYLVNGTPTDCVKLAVDQLLDGARPDVVLSGINHGFNQGVCTIYSGTMGVVFEASIHGIPAVAFSYGNYALHGDFSPCEPWIEKIVKRVLEKGLPEDVCLNVNIPYGLGEIKGMKITKAGMGKWDKEYEHRVDPHGMDYYWMTGKYVLNHPDDKDNDICWLEQNYVAVTPCKVDQTDHDSLKKIEGLLS